MAKKVLIVDDEPEAIEFASVVLEENGYIPVGAADGIEGMEKAERERPDLILLDIMMPGKGGIAMYRELRSLEATRDIPVIIITGVSRGERFEERMLRQDPEMSPPDGYIEKPMKAEVILKLVNKVLS